MNLTYRGIAYTPASSPIETTGREQTVTFLGVRYTQKSHQIAQRYAQPHDELTFLGRRYSR